MFPFFVRIERTFWKRDGEPFFTYLKLTLIESLSIEKSVSSSQEWILRNLSSQVSTSSHDRCVCGDEGDPDHYATNYPVTKTFHFMNPSAENLLM
ncbi:hypothetical protein AVEN_196400-1 [Araneus ventricosus]|uniref:Uncharacterized protein n=1 Tax=Araneus ventricosus TaxID=182803 RepID=A0A4Y2AWV9_ARAVE|nr:hypothetical protein AVEN_196400-1 [Araneus ventricosus]